MKEKSLESTGSSRESWERFAPATRFRIPDSGLSTLDSRL